jgi:hypothetical protein
MKKAVFNSLGHKIHTVSSGGSKGSVTDAATHTYNLKITYKTNNTGSDVVYTGLSVQLAQSGSTSNILKIATSAGTTDRNFTWATSNTSVAGALSDSIIQHAGFTQIERS